MARGRRRRWLLAGLLAGFGFWALLGQALAAGASGATAVPGGSGLPAGTGLHVIPFPGTPDASPRSPVIFSSLSPAEIRAVQVTGSRTGQHPGRLEALPGHAGTAFLPRRPFAPGEAVQVVAELRSPAAGTASGEPGATRLGFSFGVGVSSAPTRPTRASAPETDGLHPPGARAVSASPTRTFHSAPGLKPPVVSVSSDGDNHSGDIFLTPGPNHGGGLMILNGRGQLVWYDSVAPAATFNLAVQTYRGHPVLTWFQGAPPEDVIANRSYETVAVVKAVGGYTTDVHDFLITPQGTAFLEASTNVKANLTSVGGPRDGEIHDYLIQEVDIRTGQLLWQWDCYGHIPLNASHMPLPKARTPWDAFHLNSFQLLPDGNLLISVRHTWSVYKISTRTGRILWTLGGRYNQFKMGPGTRFEWQHDAHRIGNTLTLFDDAAAPQEEAQSSAKELALHVGSRTVTLLHRYTHTPPLLSPAQGSMQTLPNGNVFVGWGTQPDFSEYTPAGRQIFNGSFALGTSSYRAYRFRWTGEPATPPDLDVATASHGRANVWVSWNGATNVAAWQLLGGPTPLTLRPLATQPDRSFETHFTLKSRPVFVEVRALNAHSAVLPRGTSSARLLGLALLASPRGLR